MGWSISERVHAPVSDEELRRRWQAVRTAMEEEGVDALVLHNNTEGIGGYVKWFSDLPAGGGYPLSIVFPREDDMTLVMHGPNGMQRALPPEGDGLLRGVRTVATAWSFASAAYCRTYDAEHLVAALRPMARGVIGLVGTAQMPHPLVEYLKSELPEATFLEASDLVDPIKAIKSEEERTAIRGVAAQQEAAFAAALAAVAPGARESDVVTAALGAAQEHGSEGGVIMLGSGPPGEPAFPNPRRHQNRILRAGDRLVLLVESCGPGGAYSELGRTIVIGAATDAMHAEHAFAVEAQRFCTELLVPGASSREVFAAYNAYLREHGRPEEGRIHCHGQGYDMVERPLVRSDEPMAIARDMNIACHPMYVRDGMTYWVCDGFLIGPDGPAERLHDVPQQIFEV